MINNSTIKCKNCKHYIKSNNYNKCNKFKNVKTVEIVRENNNLCGIEAKYFEPNQEFLNKYVIDFYGDL